MKILLELLGDACQLMAGLDRLSDLRPESRGRLHALLQQMRYESNRLLEADDAETSAENAAPVAARDAILQRALEALATERFQDAAGILSEGVALYPDADEFHSYLGLISWEQEEIEAAERHYRRAVELCNPLQLALGEDDSKGLRALEGQALCLYKLGRVEEALPLFEVLGSSRREEYAGCRYLAGEIRHLLGDIDGAIAFYKDVPVEPAVLYNLGLAVFEQDDLEQAAATFIRAFVSNIHIACALLGRFGYQASCVPGYLGSEQYAEEFVSACARIWQRAPGSFTFLERCFDHALIQSHLKACAERGGDMMLSTVSGLSEQDGWAEQFHDEPTLTGLAERVLQRLDA